METSKKDDFHRLLEKIFQERGLDFRQYREPCLRRRIDTRLRANAVATYADYIELLDRSPSEYEQLLDVATINVTEFFRDKDVWELLRKKLLPDILTHKGDTRQRVTRIWSAGCSGGEETYGLSILFHEILGPAIDDLSIKVYGTDIDTGSLKRAAMGEYERDSIKNVPSSILERYFTFTGHSYLISDHLRLITRFTRQNMITDPPIHRVDLITCRNALIYFTRELQARVFENFYRALNPGGYLVVGKTETLWGAEHLFERVHDSERVYRKIVV